MSTPKKVWSFDLDSTIADTRQRHHLIKPWGETDWTAYSMACGDDDVIEAVALTIRALSEVHPIIFTSARDAASQQVTEAWLDKHVLPFDHVFLEAPGPYRTHAEYKLWRLQTIQQEHNLQVVCHWDDWADVTNILNANGIPSVCVRTPQELAEVAAGDHTGLFI